MMILDNSIEDLGGRYSISSIGSVATLIDFQSQISDMSVIRKSQLVTDRNGLTSLAIWFKGSDMAVVLSTLEDNGFGNGCFNIVADFVYSDGSAGDSVFYTTAESNNPCGIIENLRNVLY